MVVQESQQKTIRNRHRNDKHFNGLVFKTNEKFQVNDETIQITVTLYILPTYPKLHIQSGKQYANDEFILRELPELYQEVRRVTLHITLMSEPELWLPELRFQLNQKLV